MAQQKDTVVLHFEFNRSQITAAAAATLDSLVNTPGKFQQVKLFGHCDFIGSNAYNDSLSQARILSVKKILLGKGLPDSVFAVETAYGERKPARTGITDEARAYNRRVELLIEKTIIKTAPTTNLTERIKDSAVSANLVLENLNFEGGRHFLLPESIPILEELLKALQNNPTVVIEIQGYVCCIEPDEDGLDLDLNTYNLSVQRAKAIYEYLIEKGIDARRLRYEGYGGRRKLFPYERDEYERSKNRRVEIKIISK